VIKVLGLGGGGCNAVNRMIELGISGVDFIAANSDYQALKNSLAPVRVQLGPTVTRGLGAGGKPEIGQAAAEESHRDLAAALEGADMVFVTAGMGGGTGTGSIPVAARIARSVGAVTIAVVTTPFSFEMGRRQRNASEGLAALRPHTDTLISIPNDRLLYVAPRNLPLEVAFRLADDVLRQAVQGITELITEPGLINVDFAHIQRLMKLGGGALMSIGQGQGNNKARQAIEQALHHPLLDTVSLDQAAGIIANFTGGDDLALYEVSEVLNELHAQVGADTEIVMGVIHDESMTGRAQVILIVTGLGALTLEEVFPGVMSQIPQGTGQVSIAQHESLPANPVNYPPTTTLSPNVNYQEIAKPEDNHPETTFIASPNMHANNLDIPAFLRRRIRLNNPPVPG
jgi:cell division protein FtsZ